MERIILCNIGTISCKKRSVKISAVFAKNQCKTANIGSSSLQLHGVDLIDMQIQNCFKNLFLYYIKRM